MRRVMFTALVMASGAFAQGMSPSASNPPQTTYENPPPGQVQGQQAQAQPATAGRWIHDDRDGWIWVPDNPQTRRFVHTQAVQCWLYREDTGLFRVVVSAIA
jgi:hypothetical protein